MEKKKKFEKILEEHSWLESERSLSEVESSYQLRLDQAVSTWIMEPYCIPHVEENQESVEMIVDTKDFYLEKDFGFYHHTSDEILKYAVENRANWRLHMDHMEQLYAIEYPAPNDSGKAYMVSTNGQHRRLVYHSIGFPRVKATVQKSTGNKWRYDWRGRNPAAEKILIWFRELGLIDRLSDFDKKPILIESEDHLAAWILPNPSGGSLTKMLKEINHRLTLIEKAFGPLHHESLPMIRSKFYNLLSIQLAYNKRGKWE